jgi:hypothetical protein
MADETEYYTTVVEDLFDSVSCLLFGRPFPRRSVTRADRKRSRGAYKPRASLAASSSSSAQLPVVSRDPAPLAAAASEVYAKVDKLLQRLARAIVQLQMQAERIDAQSEAARRATVALDVLEFKANLCALGQVASSLRPRAPMEDASVSVEDEPTWLFATEELHRQCSLDRYDLIDGLSNLVDQHHAAIALQNVEQFIQLIAESLARSDVLTADDIARYAGDVNNFKTAVLQTVRSDPAMTRFVSDLASNAVEALHLPRTPPARAAIAVPVVASKQIPLGAARGPVAAPNIQHEGPEVSGDEGETGDEAVDAEEEEEEEEEPESPVAPPPPPPPPPKKKKQKDLSSTALQYHKGMKPGEVGALIRDFYLAHNPTKMSDVPHIVTAFEGRYGRLFDALNHKYLGLGPQHEPNPPLPELVAPLKYDPTVNVDAAAAEVAVFYSQVAPEKVRDARAVVLRHKDDLHNLYTMLNCKYLVGFGAPMSAAKEGFDSTHTSAEEVARATEALRASTRSDRSDRGPPNHHTATRPPSTVTSGEFTLGDSTRRRSSTNIPRPPGPYQPPGGGRGRGGGRRRRGAAPTAAANLLRAVRNNNGNNTRLGCMLRSCADFAESRAWRRHCVTRPWWRLARRRFVSMTELTFRIFTHAPRRHTNVHDDFHSGIHEPVAAALLRSPGLWASGGGVEVRERAVSGDDDDGGGSMQPAFSGKVELGGSLGDAWAAAHVLLEYTSAHPDCAVLLETDEGDLGDFLLVEAAELLPAWCSPEVMAYRVALVRGSVVIVPPAPLLLTTAAGTDCTVSSECLRHLVDLWRRYELRGLPVGAVGGSDAIDNLSEGVLLRFLLQVVLPATSSGTDGRQDRLARELCDAMWSALHLPLVAASIATRAQREAAALFAPHRACAVLPVLAAACIQQAPALANRALYALREAATAAHGPPPRLPQSRLLPIGDEELVKVQVLLPKFTFAMGHFTELPDAMPVPHVRNEGAKNVVILGAKLALGLALLESQGLLQDILACRGAGPASESIVRRQGCRAVGPGRRVEMDGRFRRGGRAPGSGLGERRCVRGPSGEAGERRGAERQRRRRRRR